MELVEVGRGQRKIFTQKSVFFAGHVLGSACLFGAFVHYARKFKNERAEGAKIFLEPARNYEILSTGWSESFCRFKTSRKYE